MATLEIPLTADYAYQFTMDLEGLSWNFKRIRWNDAYNAYFMDLEAITLPILIRGICLVGGSNILRPYAITELGKMHIVDTERQQQNPTFEGLGTRFKLIYIPKGGSL
jgi:hypothetical protein